MPGEAHVVMIGATKLVEETGLWCDHCLVPSVVRFTIAFEINGRPTSLQDYEGCMDGCSPVRMVR